MEKVRTVIWDCDNLMWFHKPEETAIIATKLGISDIEEFSVQFLDMIECFNTYFIKTKVNKKEIYNIIECTMPILYFYGITPKQFMDIWNGLKFEINEFNPQTTTVLKYLQEKGIKNIVKSDWLREVQEKMLKEFGVLEYIEELHCCDNSYLKCNPLSAEGIIKKRREEEYIMIGDSPRSDIAFANHAGIKSIWVNYQGKKNTTKYMPTFEITSLLEVMEII